MLFYFYAWVLPPGVFIVLLLLAAWWRRKQVLSAVVMVAMALLLYGVSIPYVSSQLLHSLEYNYPLPLHPTGDVIIALGAGVIQDVPTPAAWSGQLSDVAAQRLLAAVELQKRLGVPLLVSGGEVYAGDGNEAQVSRRLLLSLGLKESDIILEDRSLNTIENAALTTTILKERGLTQPVLLTSAFHMPRSVENFRRAGVTATPYPVAYYAPQKVLTRVIDFIPSYAAMRGTALAMKEYLGLAALKLK